MAGKQADIKVGVVTNYDDKGIKSAEKGLAGFKSSISEADGLGGKLSAGWKNASSQISANAGLMAAGAGAALVGFAVKAVGAFTQTAKAAIDLSTSTGLAVEDASRWIAVGDDYQVGADALATGLGKIAKTLDDEKWSKYGIATRDAGGKARDVNDILLDSFDTLSKVKNATERARIGQELFGKGYQSLTPILGHTRAEYEKMLGAVEKGQVITTKEAATAEKMRLAEDDLHDAVQEVTLAVGQLVAQGAPVISFFAKAILKTLEWKDALQDIDDKFGGSGIFTSAPALIGKTADAAKEATDRFRDMVKYGPFSTKEQQKQQDYADHMKNYVTPAIDDLDRAHKDLASGGVAAVTSAEEDLEQATANSDAAQLEYKRNSDNTKRAIKQNIDEIIGKWDELTGNIDDDKSWLTLQNTFDATKEKVTAAWQASADGADNAATQMREAQIAIDDQKLAVIDYAREVLKVPPERVTNILAAIDQNSWDIAQNALAILTRNRTVSLSIVAKGGPGYDTDNDPTTPYARGTTNARPGVALVGEQGPELVTMGGGESVFTANQTAAMMNGGGGGDMYVKVVMPVIASQADYYRLGQIIENAQAEYYRRRGF